MNNKLMPFTWVTVRPGRSTLANPVYWTFIQTGRWSDPARIGIGSNSECDGCQCSLHQHCILLHSMWSAARSRLYNFYVCTVPVTVAGIITSFTWRLMSVALCIHQYGVELTPTVVSDTFQKRQLTSVISRSGQWCLLNISSDHPFFCMYINVGKKPKNLTFLVMYNYVSCAVSVILYGVVLRLNWQLRSGKIKTAA